MLTVRQASDAVAAPDRERLGVAFRVLLVLRGLVLAMTVMLVPDDWRDPSLMLAVAAVATATAIACLAWRRVLSLLLRHPTLWCLDALLMFPVLLSGGALNPHFLVTVLTSAIAGVLYEWRAVLVICAAQTALFFIAAGATGQESAGTATPVLIGLPAFYPLAACAGVALRRFLDDYADLEERHRRAAAALSASEERARLAREMHDSLAKTLQGISMSAEALPLWVRRSPDQAETDARAIVAGLRVATGQARDLLTDLRDEVYQQPLDEALTTVVADWSARTGIPAATHLAKEPQVGDETTTVRYEIISIVREALTNIERHANAQHVTVSRNPSTLVINDDGRGFAFGHQLDQLARHGHYGLIGMRERAHRIGGRLTVNGAPDQGTTVTLRLPGSTR
ncbi:signal transduction histidine kinase [Actinomadura pelletieri DSM 43383]|uniref:histidine kinase n=1 Tax=Actinomadura pelletieri DSM 43383 TaxID=1120940 RepID=A0A495QX32_9ACTN|nr:histidine kinase [Actinomadura pelletieri]RKS78749.1 signal transduction histidine kinase [Actinomadura pelletieri DSM 43383]